MILPLIVFQDVEALVVQALNDGMPRFGESLHTGTRIPSPLPLEFFRVIRAAGPRETLVTEAARILLEAWAGSETRAVQLLNYGRAILFAQNGTLFGVDEYAGPANLPDPTTDRVRYTASFTVRARAARTA